MKELKKLKELVEIFSVESHKIVKDKNNAGICYLIAHCLNEYLLLLGYDSRKVTGKQALLRGGQKTKYVTYGTFSPKKFMLIGDYHSWCEVLLNDINLTIDISLIYNKCYLKKNHITLSKDIPNHLITESPNTYNYKFIEDVSLNYISDENLSTVHNWLINLIIRNSFKEAERYLNS